MLVPRQHIVDDEVIGYWKRARSLTRDEFAALVCGVNPFTWRELSTWSVYHRGEPEPISATKKQEVQDLVTLLDHRMDPFEQHGSLMEWKANLVLLGIRMPDWLDKLRSKRVQAALDRMKDPDFEKRMVESLETIRRQRGIPYFLIEWFRHDTWTAEEALLLLVGLDPGGTIVENIETIGGSVRPQIESMQTLDGMESAPRSFLEEEGDDDEGSLRDMNKREGEWLTLRAIWESGTHPARNPPSYYLDWAVVKGYSVSWLQWASENGLVKEQGPSREDDLSTKERSTLLVMISLLSELADVDIGKPSKAAETILALAEKRGLSIGKRTIEEWLKRVPDAVERRGK